MAEQSKALQVKATSINDFLMARRNSIRHLAAKHVTPERLIKGFISASTRNPRLLDCTPLSILNACIIAGELGLDVGAQIGGLHCVPFRNGRTKEYEIVPIPDYRALTDLAYRSGRMLAVHADVVRKNDHFEYMRGTELYLRHRYAEGERGDLLGAYAVAHMKEGIPIFEYLPVAKVNEYRDKSPAYRQAEGPNGKKDSPWHTDWEAMAKKTAVRRLANWLPRNPEMDLFNRAVEMDAKAEGEMGDIFEIVAEALPDEEEPKKGRSAKLKDDLKGGGVEEGSSEAGAKEGATPSPNPEPEPQQEAGAMLPRVPEPVMDGDPVPAYCQQILDSYGLGGMQEAEAKYAAIESELFANLSEVQQATIRDFKGAILEFDTEG